MTRRLISHPPHHASPIVRLHPAYQKGTAVTTPQPANIDGLFIAPDGNEWPCIWHEDHGDDFPRFVLAKPSPGPQRHLWDLLASILPEREATA